MKAALFDMDGVLCDTQKIHHSCYVDIAKQYNVTLDEKIFDKFKGILRIEGVKLFCEAINLEINDENLNHISKLKNDLYLKKIEEKKESLLNEGTVSLLKKLKDNKVKTALVSASANAKHIVKLTNIEQYFDYAVDASKVGKGKPNPAIFLEAASKLHIKPSDCVVYEDALNGLEAANVSNMYSIGVNVNLTTTTFTYNDKVADRYVTSLADPLCYRGLYENLNDSADECSLFIFDAGNVVIKDIHCFNGIFEEYNFSTQQKVEFIKDYNFYTAPLMDGNISTEFFLERINQNLNLNIKEDAFYTHFKPTLNQTIVDLINELKKQGKKVVLGSNTFAPHTKKMEEIGLFDLFDTVYVSNEMHQYKPNPSFFRYILEHEKTEANKAYFIDDLAENIASAASIGINTLHYINKDKNDKLKRVFKNIIN